MKSESARALARAPVAASSRSLSTARSVLRVLSLLVEHPDGVRADEVAQALGKSVSTAYYLLTSLCEEGFAVHESKGCTARPAGSRSSPRPSASTTTQPSLHDGLAGSVDELFLLTRKRSYLGMVKPDGSRSWPSDGRQGVPRMPGSVRRSETALMRWRWARWCSRCLRPGRWPRYVSRGHETLSRPDDRDRPGARSRASGACAATGSRSTARSSTRTSAASRRRSSTSAAGSSPRSACRSPPTCSTPSATAGADRHAGRRRCPAGGRRAGRAGRGPGRVTASGPAPRPGCVHVPVNCKQMRKTASFLSGAKAET